MVECRFKINSPNDIVKVGFFNDCIDKEKEIYYDELMVRPDGIDIFKRINDTALSKNNMVYKFSTIK